MAIETIRQNTLTVEDVLKQVERREWHGKIPPQIELIYGSMFCGKTEELIRRIRRAVIAKHNVQVFKSKLDDRYSGVETVNSHSESSYPATPFSKSTEILDNLDQETTVVGIDEAQFADEDIVPICDGLVKRNIRVIAAGLMFDFRQEFFGPMPKLFQVADTKEEFFAICTVCGGQANRTQRIVNGIPAHYDDPIIMVGAKEAYEARCREHHDVPR